MPPSIDVEGLRADLDALRARTMATLDGSDLRQLRSVVIAGRLCTLVGFATAWLGVNPLSVVGISLGIVARWAVMHHVGHGAYERVPGAPAHYTRKRFAMGARRWIDWLCWIDPSAWIYEHNHLHHYYTSELTDPDLVDRNLALLREIRLPRWLKYVVVFVGASTWRATYYAANALNGLAAKERGEKDAPHRNVISLTTFWDLRIPLVRRYWAGCVAPYFLIHFVLIPSLFLPLGPEAALFVLLNRVLGEALANLHTFAVIVPSHAADDLFAFEGHYRSKGEFYARQILCTANYRTGGAVRDFLHMFINYQIEHHLFPELPMRSYQRIQPEVRAICEKHGLPYVQQGVFTRLRKLLDVCVGKADMPRVQSPEAFATARA